ncbi:retinol dehydrogenase 8-like [Glandiceps talaboti]
MAQQVVVITGCSTGIGLSLAAFLAKDTEKRYRVYGTMRNLAKQSELVKAAGQSLNETLFIQKLDVTNDESVETFFKDVLDKEERVDILVNNAGISIVAIFECIPMATIRNVMETNYFGVVRTIHAVLPTMKKQRSGKIINISSLFGVAGTPFSEIYASAKFAMEGMSECLAPTLRKFNVYLSTVQMGPVITAVRENMQTLLKDVDLSTADEASIELMRLNESNRQQMIKGESLQTADEAAQVVINIIEEQQPKFRYQASEAIRVMISRKLVDPTGEGAVNNSIKNFLTEC